MKIKFIMTKAISLVLCILVLFGNITTAYGNSEVDINSQIIYNENITFSDIFGSFIESLFPNGKTQIQSKGAVLEVIPPFILVPLHSKASAFSSIESLVFVWSNVTVLGYEGFYTKVRVNNTEKEGYIFKFFLSSDEDFLVKQFDNVYIGKTKSILKDYNNPEDFNWSVSQDGIISLDRETGQITGLKPGTVVVTAKYGNSTDTCIVSSINQWNKTELSSAAKDIVVKSNPDSNNYNNFEKGTISKGESIVARGDMADGSGWIYVSSGGTWGFIKLSDFPGIDYLMTQYHYYDEGYEKRFGSAESKIYDYASVLNDVMMDLFNLKVCPYVYSYTSVTDQCKIWRYGSVYSGNLSSSCPKNGNHKTDSCLQTGYLREDLKNSFGNGGGTVSKVAWTGHIMTDHDNDRSNSTVGVGTIIITPYKTVQKTSSGYVNDSSYEIRRDSISTLMHETIHQLGVHDHYCYEDKGGDDGVKCSNKGGCYKCYGNNIKPDCMMMTTKYPTEDSVLLCNKCKSQVFEYLSNNF